MRISKKILAIALSILMAVSMMPFTAFAAEANLSDILASASSKYVEITDTDITVDADTTLTGHILDLYGNTTIDLNGHNLVAGATNSSGQEVAIWINPGANVTITDSAQPSTAATYSTSTGLLTVKDGVAAISSTYYGIINEGNLTLGKVVVKGDNNAICVTDGGSLTTSEANSIVCGGTYGVTYPGGNATLNLTKGMIYGQYGLSGNSFWDSANNKYKFGGNTINIGAAKIYGKGIDDEGDGVNGAAIVLGADDDCNITGNATIYGYNAPAIVTRASADLDITGAPTVNTYGTLTNVKVLDGSTTVPCAPVVVDTACGYTKAADIDVDIANGTYKANVAGVENAVALVGKEGDKTSDFVDVTTGTFATTAGADATVPYDDTAYTQDGNGKLIPTADIGTTYKVAYTDANGKTTYTTGISGPLKNGTYKLLDDVSASSLNVGSTMYTNQNAIIDLNGHDLTLGFRSGFGSLYNGSTNSSLTITGEGTVDCAEAPDGYANLGFTNGTLTIDEDVVVEGSVAYFGNATVNVYGTVITDKEDDFAISSNNAQASGTTLNIYDGAVVTSTNGIAIYHPEDGELNMYGGTVTGKTGIYAKRGEINVTGGTVAATGADTGYVSSGNGASATGDAIVLDNMNGYAGTLTASISGGTITSANADAVVSEAPASMEAIDEVIPSDSTAVFSSDVTALAADGYETVYDANQGGYVVAEDTHTVAVIGDAKYDTLEAAFAAAVDGDTITLTQNCGGNGISVPVGKFPTGLTVDFAGYTYTCDGALAGSPKTKSQAFQLLKDNTITFKNGTIYSEKARMLVQNYSNLTLENMTLTLNNTTTAPKDVYTLSNNNGSVVIDGSTINANPVANGGTAYAFDVCRYNSYTGVDVTVTGNSTINGDVQIDIQNGDPKNGATLTLESGTMSGDIELTADAEKAIVNASDKAGVSKDVAFDKDAPEGFKWNADGDLVLVDDGMSVVADSTIGANFYLAAAEGDTVVITYNTNNLDNDINVVNKTVSKTLTANDKHTAADAYQGTYEVKGLVTTSPAQMGDDITVTIKRGDAVIRSFTTSVAEYAKALTADATYGDLAKAMLDYGKAAQETFEYQGNPVAADYNNDLTDNTRANIVVNSPSLSGSILLRGITYNAWADPTLRIYLNDQIGTDGLTVSSTLGTATICQNAAGAQFVEISGIGIEDLDEEFTMTLGDTSLTISGLYWVKNASGDSAKLAQAIYNYYTAYTTVFNA